MKCECPKCHHEFEQKETECAHENKERHLFLPQWTCKDCEKTFITLPLN